MLAALLAAVACQQAPGSQVPEEDRRPLPVPRAVVEPRGDRRIDIDGSLIDWPKLPPIDLTDPRLLSGTALGAWRGPMDLSGYVFMLWDEDALYVGASVQDEWHRGLTGEAPRLTEIPPSDAIVLTFDPERDTRSIGPDPGRAEDREFWIAEEPSHRLVQWDRLRGTARTPEDGRQIVSHDQEKGITTYEARIPWSEILPPGRQARSGLVFDLQIVLDDYDEVTDPMPQTRIGWTFGCGPVIDPGLFGSVMLVDSVAALGGALPEFPVRGGPAGPVLPNAEYWAGFVARLRERGPAVHDGSAAPDVAGGIERLRMLEELDDQCDRFPRVDWLELHHRINRRMTREVAGIEAFGLPAFWRVALLEVARAAEQQPPPGTLRMFRLPMGGWLARTSQRNFAIDPADAAVGNLLWGGMEFVLVTQPLDMTRRNDQLLVRMAVNKPPRPYLTHIAMHLPVVAMNDMKLVDPGVTYGQDSGIKVIALGHKADDGSVPYALGYHVMLPGGVAVFVASPATRPDEVPAEPVDVLVLPVRNPDAVEIAQRTQCGVILIDDQFLPQTFPTQVRVRLADALALQKAVLPKSSILLAPGEAWDVKPAK